MELLFEFKEEHHGLIAKYWVSPNSSQGSMLIKSKIFEGPGSKNSLYHDQKIYLRPLNKYAFFEAKVLHLRIIINGKQWIIILYI